MVRVGTQFGIATQREDLRRKFTGRPEQVIAFFRALAFDIRQHLAHLGFNSLQEAIGRADVLAPVDGSTEIDVSALTWAPPIDDPRPRRFVQGVRVTRPAGGG